MKKLITTLFFLLSLFAISSCNQTLIPDDAPQEEQQESDSQSRYVFFCTVQEMIKKTGN